MKKILLFIDILGPGGAQRQLVGLAAYLKEKGYDVTLMAYYEHQFFTPFLKEHKIKTVYVSGATSFLRKIRFIGKVIKAESPDWVISYIEGPSIIACILKLLGAKWKLMVSERNTTLKNNFREWRRFNIFRVADCLVTNSYSQQEFIHKHYHFLDSKVMTIINFVDLDYFKCDKVREPGEKKQVIIVSSINPHKNGKGLVRAVRILADKNPNFHIKWFGLGPNVNLYANQCKEIIRDLNIQDYIELLPRTPQIRDRYCEADILCLPSFYEGTPNVICEACACSLPVVCSNVCDNAKYVHDGENGFLFDPSSPDDIAEKLLQAISMNVEQYKSFSRQSRLVAEQQFSKERFVQQYIEIIEKGIE